MTKKRGLVVDLCTKMRFGVGDCCEKAIDLDIPGDKMRNLVRCYKKLSGCNPHLNVSSASWTACLEPGPVSASLQCHWFFTLRYLVYSNNSMYGHKLFTTRLRFSN